MSVYLYTSCSSDGKTVVARAFPASTLVTAFLYDLATAQQRREQVVGIGTDLRRPAAACSAFRWVSVYGGHGEREAVRCRSPENLGSRYGLILAIGQGRH